MGNRMSEPVNGMMLPPGVMDMVHAPKPPPFQINSMGTMSAPPPSPGMNYGEMAQGGGFLGAPITAMAPPAMAPRVNNMQRGMRRRRRKKKGGSRRGAIRRQRRNNMTDHNNRTMRGAAEVPNQEAPTGGFRSGGTDPRGYYANKMSMF